ncbi:unnamed protein product [Lactuca saligna]|uniref:Uncharacterized protein n=1 Tax=Lactuca saligna TaxID=75948 RepID=A0AA36A3J2_LACSI|nr:unnamed protein product [Lactuca saligna]
MLRLVETRDSLVTVSVQQHLSDKLQPVFPMLNQIECVSGSGSLPKQGGDKEPQPKQTNEEQRPKTQIDQKDYEASASTVVNQILFSFYLKYAKPQYKTLSLKKICALRVKSPIQTEDFLNIQFKGFRGADKIMDEFTLVDSFCMNPCDWISLFIIVMKDEQKYKPIVAHLKRMLICYILEITKMDVEIASVRKKSQF